MFLADSFGWKAGWYTGSLKFTWKCLLMVVMLCGCEGKLDQISPKQQLGDATTLRFIIQSVWVLVHRGAPRDFLWENEPVSLYLLSALELTDWLRFNPCKAALVGQSNNFCNLFAGDILGFSHEKMNAKHWNECDFFSKIYLKWLTPAIQLITWCGMMPYIWLSFKLLVRLHAIWPFPVQLLGTFPFGFPLFTNDINNKKYIIGLLYDMTHTLIYLIIGLLLVTTESQSVFGLPQLQNTVDSVAIRGNVVACWEGNKKLAQKSFA